MVRSILRFFGFLFAWTSIGSLLAVGAVAAIIWMYGRELPDTSTLAAYEPKTLSRAYSGEGRLLDEFARERRIFTPSDEIPALVKQAFISAEDKNFYAHSGFDALGIAKAVYDAAMGHRLRGASTITQQVMKNFLL
ncbi:MAG TPA: transglycosylase domain-containing protein, partial [Paracoccaceae bacterium]|nr:transglycosylase domain-containing protein [Paracoccaceae bacterium]